VQIEGADNTQVKKYSIKSKPLVDIEDVIGVTMKSKKRQRRKPLRSARK